MKLLIPMAGEGSRFFKAGYTVPKPLIEIHGKPMIQWVIENLDNPSITEFIFIVRKEHIDKYKIDEVLKSICCGRIVRIVSVDRLLQGSAMSILEARQYINNLDDVLVANSDQFIEFSKDNFKTIVNYTNSYGYINSLIFTFRDSNPKWSFVLLNEDNSISKVAEKDPISNIANCGVFWFRSGYELLKQIDSMVENNFTVNNEYYLAPSYNFANKSNLVYPFFVEKMWGLGTPEDLNIFLNDYHFS